MHILFVADGDSKYGAQNSLYQLIGELFKLDEKIQISIVLTRQSDRVKDFQRIGCKVYRIPYVPFYQEVPESKFRFAIKYVLRGFEYWYGRLFAVSILEKKLAMNTVNIIHSNSSREDLGATLSKKYKIPLVWHIREFGDLDFSCYSYRKDFIEMMNESATVFIAISKAVMKHWIYKGINPDKIVHIYNGVTVNECPKMDYPEAKDNSQIKFVMMGALSETKGQHIAIEAIILLPQTIKNRIQLDIVGDGKKEYTKRLKSLISINNLENQVHLLGYQKDFYKKLNCYDCGLMCSRSEGFGRVTVEYMMAGLPVIASNTGANTEIVYDDVNGMLYQYGDSRDLAKKLVYIINNVNKLSKLGGNAYKTASENYTANINASKIYEEYNKIIRSEK